jgi:hypothetical protein
MNHKTDCIACGKNDLVQILDLNKQPLANSYHKGEELPEYPLGLNLCKNCYHLQLTHIVNPDELFKNYLYISGTTTTLKEYFKWFAKWTSGKVTPYTKSVLDIACNDGTQLDAFKELGWETYGVDPAENLYPISSKNHNVMCGYFDHTAYWKQFDIIVAQNVFAHTEKALEFLNNASYRMHDDSLLFIQTSQAEMVKSNQFDTIYHEHLSFFNVNSMLALANRSGLTLVDVEKVPVHGISYVFTFSKRKDAPKKYTALLEEEISQGLTSMKTYIDYAENVSVVVSELKSFIDTKRNEGFKIAAYGAAAKGMTLLNYAGIVPDIIVDDNDMKVGLYTPGTNVRIDSPCALTGIDKPIVILPLAWNFYDEIKSRVSHRQGKGDIWVKYFPSLQIETV